MLGFQAGFEPPVVPHRHDGRAGPDVPLYPTGDGLTMGVAGNPTGIVTAALHQAPGRSFKILTTRTVNATTGAAGPARRVSRADAVFFDLTSRPAGRHEIDLEWTAKDDELHSSYTYADVSGAWQPVRHIMSGRRSGLAYLTDLDTSSGLVVGSTNRVSDGAQVIWQAGTRRLYELPGIAARKRSTYAPGKRTIILGLAITRRKGHGREDRAAAPATEAAEAGRPAVGQAPAREDHGEAHPDQPGRADSTTVRIVR